MSRKFRNILSPKNLGEVVLLLGGSVLEFFFSFLNSIIARQPPGYVQECDIKWDYATFFATNYRRSCLDEV